MPPPAWLFRIWFVRTERFHATGAYLPGYLDANGQLTPLRAVPTT
jgi:hypothetical protein